jgi:succinyl-CoA:acetate CoA-transferase
VCKALIDLGYKGVNLFTELGQDGAFDLLDAGVADSLSCAGLGLSPPYFTRLMENLGDYRGRVVLRPQYISNNLALIQAMGVWGVNAVACLSTKGDAASSVVDGKILNGIGGSGDFNRGGTGGAILRSTYKGRSNILPVVEVDHPWRDVAWAATEHGTADYRGLDPRQRMKLTIERCVAPQFRVGLLAQFHAACERGGYIPQGASGLRVGEIQVESAAVEWDHPLKAPFIAVSPWRGT